MESSVDHQPGREKEKTKGVAFIFPHEVGRDGTIDAETKERLNMAVRLQQKGKIGTFLIVGGVFRNTLKEPISTTAKSYLQQQGIDENSIITERLSSDAITGILFGYLDILKRFGPEKYRTDETIYATEDELKESFRQLSKQLPIYWVTSAYHIARLQKILASNGLLAPEQQFISPADFIVPEKLSEKLTELMAQALLKLEKDGRGPLTTYLRVKRGGRK